MNDQSSIDTRDHVIKDDLITTSVVDTISNEGNDFEGGSCQENEDEESDVDNDGEIEQEEGGSEPAKTYKRILLQRFTVYNSASTMYIVGSNAKESLYRILEIAKDVEDEQSLSIIEDKSYFYTRKDMIELLNGLNDSVEGGLHKLAHGYGLLGLVRFTRGYYLNLITKCSQVAILGGHFIYHIDETKLIPLGTNYKRPEKYSDEEKLLSLFRYMDLSKTFYFSYNYDITNSMQTNFMRHKLFNCRDERAKLQNRLYANFDYNERFVWNSLLLKPILESEDVATFEWFQPIVHGFIDQANISIYGRKFYITIIARRSHHFAGARFLKRGINDKGNVANEIETEQIVSDMLTSSFHDPKFGMYSNPRYTSFVQHRGSIPLYWTQDMNKLPKPPIQINLSDPFYQSAALHFDNLFYRYGSPIIILNLIKQKEKQPRESRLNIQYINCINYLNQFLPEANKLHYRSFDMSKNSKKNMDVITPCKISHMKRLIKLEFSTMAPQSTIPNYKRVSFERIQLRSLELISEGKTLDYESDLINILTEIFHDHGDTIAIQYGGSNLVNTMDSYRRINQWSSHTRDMLNSIKRMYSNSFMDSIRQEAINLFLGNYEYSPDRPKLWELSNDFVLHFDFDLEMKPKRSYTHWFNDANLKDDRFMIKNKGETGDDLNKMNGHHPLVSNDKWYNECYVPRKYQSFTELFHPFESRKFKHSDKAVGGEEISYLEHQLNKCENDATDCGASESDGKRVTRSSSGRYNPKNIKTFLASKITARHNAKKRNEKQSSSADMHRVNVSTDGGRDSEDNEGDDEKTLYSVNQPIIDKADAKLYQSQFDLSHLMKSNYNYASYCSYKSTRLKPSFQDQEIYKASCLDRELHCSASEASRSPFVDMVNTQDLKIYLQYINDEEKLLELGTDHNYI
ncbi:unnamed protein product [Candida parapsilosis]